MNTALATAFGPLMIEFDNRVLRPRRWTVMQSEWAAELAAAVPDGPILELFAGAGQIGLLAAALTGRALVQVDADAVAVAFAARNATTAGLPVEVDIRHAPVDDALGETERFPLILADPPYLRSSEIDRFPDDPATAIDGGEDGLALLRATLGVVSAHLAPGGACLVQVAGPPQVDELRRLVDTEWPALTLASSRAVDAERAVALITRR